MELGELPVVALARELFEEASARMVACEPLGVCRFRDPDGRIDHHGFYWARVVLGDGWVASEEIAEFRLVEPDEFLDALEWGRSDPKAEVLLQLALEREAVQRW